jgi:23S rRNA pseudouridine2605 synthase
VFLPTAAEEIILGPCCRERCRGQRTGHAKADPDHDTITVDGKKLGVDTVRVYLVLYKPAGYMTTLKDPQGRPLVTDLLKGIRERVYPVGRLDYNTEGVLLLTNDGEWANALAHPRHEVDKEYHVRVQGQVSPVQINRLTAVELKTERPHRRLSKYPR